MSLWDSLKKKVASSASDASKTLNQLKEKYVNEDFVDKIKSAVNPVDNDSENSDSKNSDSENKELEAKSESELSSETNNDFLSKSSNVLGQLKELKDKYINKEMVEKVKSALTPEKDEEGNYSLISKSYEALSSNSSKVLQKINNLTDKSSNVLQNIKDLTNNITSNLTEKYLSEEFVEKVRTAINPEEDGVIDLDDFEPKPTITYLPKLELFTLKDDKANLVKKPDFEFLRYKYLPSRLKFARTILSDKELQKYKEKKFELLEELLNKLDDSHINFIIKEHILEEKKNLYALQECNFRQAYEIFNNFFKNKSLIDAKHVADVCLKFAEEENIDSSELHDLYYCLAEYYRLHDDNPDESIKYYEKAIENHNGEASYSLLYFVGLAYACINKGNYEKAKAVLEKILAADDDKYINLRSIKQQYSLLEEYMAVKEDAGFACLADQIDYKILNEENYFRLKRNSDEEILKACNLMALSRISQYREKRIEKLKKALEIIPKSEHIKYEILINTSFLEDERSETAIKHNLEYPSVITGYVLDLYNEACQNSKDKKSTKFELAYRVFNKRKRFKNYETQAFYNSDMGFENHLIYNKKFSDIAYLFNSKIYSEAVKRMNNAVFKRSKDIEDIFACLLIDDFYSYNYRNSFLDLGYVENALEAFLSNKDRRLLPFLYTLIGDTDSHILCEDSVCSLYYKLAINELDLLPECERFTVPYIRLARIYEANKQYKESLEFYETAKRIDKDCDLDSEINRVKAYLDGKGEEYQERGEACFKKAQENYMKGNFVKALEESLEGLKYVPESYSRINNICDYAYATKNYFMLKNAALELERLYDGKESKPRYNYFYALCLFYEQRYKEAEELLSNEIKQNRKNDDICDLLKRCYIALGYNDDFAENLVANFRENNSNN